MHQIFVTNALKPFEVVKKMEKGPFHFIHLLERAKRHATIEKKWHTTTSNFFQAKEKVCYILICVF